MSIKLKDIGDGAVQVSFWDVHEIGEAVSVLMARCVEKFGVGVPIEINGETRDDKGFLDPGHLVAKPARRRK